MAARDVLVAVEDARITAVEAEARRPNTAVPLAGLTLPGFANTHSHAFHRLLRGRTERSGSFWTWRDEMYALADALGPHSYGPLARAVYGEMALAGFTAVGEFHYLHHDSLGQPYVDPNAMGRALAAASGDAGIRITLLDACYLEASPGRSVTGVQRRFNDGDAVSWVKRVEQLDDALGGPTWAKVGAAVHSLRAVPPSAVEVVADWAARRGAPLHVHVSEQRAENEAVRAAYGATPCALLAQVGALGPRTTVIHGTHLDPSDIESLGATDSRVCVCPTTERFLADGVGPAGALAAAGSHLCLGTDCHALIDPFEEMRGLELGERITTGKRGRFQVGDLLEAATAQGHAALGWPDAGMLVPGAFADLVTVSLDSPRLAGAGLDHVLERVVFSASAGDVCHVVASGRPIVHRGRHLLLGDLSAQLSISAERILELGAGGAVP